MKKLLIILSISVSLIAQANTDNLILIDTIQTVIYGTEGTEIVTLSDVNKPSLGGGLRTQDEIVFERLLVLDAERLHAMPSEEETDKTINTICRENGLTKEEFEQVARGAGYTPESAREQFRNMHAANKMMDYKVRSRLVVPKSEVEAYCKEHPEFTTPEYQLEYTFTPESSFKTPQEQERELNEFASGTRMIPNIQWSDPFWVAEADIAADYQFITQLKLGEIKVHFTPGKGFELYKLVDSKPAREKTAEERYFDVADILRQPRAQQLMDEYKKDLYSSMSILNLN